jgi:GntR family transcriptional repressor for pyruvate dehydrogenase complex
MLMIVIPDIMDIYHKDKICAPNRAIIEEHERMLECIKNKNRERGAELMTQHLQGVLDFAKSKLETI